MKKYELTDNWKLVNGVRVCQIRLLKDLKGFKAGELLGYIEKEDNLSQTDMALVFGEGVVMDSERIRPVGGDGARLKLPAKAVSHIPPQLPDASGILPPEL